MALRRRPQDGDPRRRPRAAASGVPSRRLLKARRGPLTGGQFTRGTNFEMKHFSDKDLKRLLEGSRPMNSPFSRKHQKGNMRTKTHVLKGMSQQLGINMDRDKRP